MNDGFVVLGSKGQVGRAWTALLGHRALAFDRGEVDLGSPDFTAQLEDKVDVAAVKAVINAAAYTRVDEAEAERDEAMRINAGAVGELGEWCDRHSIPVVHYSTDYIFDGNGNTPWLEEAPPDPLNTYGTSKLEGERQLAAAGGKRLVFRSSWVYDAHGRNFFNAMLRLMREREQIAVVDDQIGAPTYAPHLALASFAALMHALAAPVFPTGTYHLAGGGVASWYDFAQAIFTLERLYDPAIKCEAVGPIVTADYPTAARRPLNSRLDCSKAQKVFGVRLPPWEEGLRACFKEKYGR